MYTSSSTLYHAYIAMYRAYLCTISPIVPPLYINVCTLQGILHMYHVLSYIHVYRSYMYQASICKTVYQSLYALAPSILSMYTVSYLNHCISRICTSTLYSINSFILYVVMYANYRSLCIHATSSPILHNYHITQYTKY